MIKNRKNRTLLEKNKLVIDSRLEFEVNVAKQELKAREGQQDGNMLQVS